MEATRERRLPLGIHNLLPANRTIGSRPLPEVKPEDPGLILYTSGTTSRPKGAARTHNTLREMANPVCKTTPDCSHTSLLITQMTYIIAIGGILLPAISIGATVVVAPAFEAGLVLDLIERFQCRRAVGLPSMAQFFARRADREAKGRRFAPYFLCWGRLVAVKYASAIPGAIRNSAEANTWDD